MTLYDSIFEDLFASIKSKMENRFYNDYSQILKFGPIYGFFNTVTPSNIYLADFMLQDIALINITRGKAKNSNIMLSGISSKKQVIGVSLVNQLGINECSGSGCRKNCEAPKHFAFLMFNPSTVICGKLKPNPCISYLFSVDIAEPGRGISQLYNNPHMKDADSNTCMDLVSLILESMPPQPMLTTPVIKSVRN